jgi:hypothetical protein
MDCCYITSSLSLRAPKSRHLTEGPNGATGGEAQPEVPGKMLRLAGGTDRSARLEIGAKMLS